MLQASVVFKELEKDFLSVNMTIHTTFICTSSNIFSLPQKLFCVLATNDVLCLSISQESEVSTLVEGLGCSRVVGDVY